MRENQLPVHYTSDDEGGRVRPALDLGDDEARDSKVGMWLLAFAAIFVYAICNPDWVHSGAQADKISKPLSDGITRSADTAPGGTAVTDAAQAGAHRNFASDCDETVTNENSRLQTHNGDDTARSNAGNSGAGGGMLPALSPQLKPITKEPVAYMNQGFNEAVTIPVTEMPKAAGTKTSKPKKSFLVPPPPPTPCVFPPAVDLFPMQTAQEYAALQQQLQQSQGQASPKTHNQPAAQENTLQQPTAPADRTEATQSAALAAADKELQAAVRSSLRTVGEWAR